jgi:hypothetical protein
VVGIRIMIGRSLTPLNSSKTTRDVTRRDENSRARIRNVDGDSSADDHDEQLQHAVIVAGVSVKIQLGRVLARVSFLLSHSRSTVCLFVVVCAATRSDCPSACQTQMT